MFAQGWIWGYLAVVLSLWLPITYWCVKKGKAKRQAGKGITQSYTDTRQPYQLQIRIADQDVVINNIEENPDNMSITGTVNRRQAAVVLNKRQLPPNLSLKQRLEHFAWALLDTDLKGHR